MVRGTRKENDRPKRRCVCVLFFLAMLGVCGGIEEVVERRSGVKEGDERCLLYKEECVGCRWATIGSPHPFGTYSLPKTKSL
jgi:hypothetical protein